MNLEYNHSKPIYGEVFYKVLRCINTSKTEEQLNSCQRLVDNFGRHYHHHFLSDIVLQEVLNKKLESLGIKDLN